MPAQFEINIIVNSSTATQSTAAVGKGLDDVKTKAKETGAAIQQAFEFYAIFEMAKEIEHLADGYTEIQNRLKAVTSDTNNLNRMTEETLRVANETRTSWEKTATTYQRLGVATKDMGTGQRDLLTITRELAEAQQISGQSSEQAERGVQQLQRAFATGSLRGREFNTFFKTFAPVMDDLAGALHMSTTQFVSMGRAGQVTGEMLQTAFLGAADKIHDKFEKLTPTLSQSFTVLTNQAQHFFGQLDTDSGFLEMLSKSILFVAKNFDTFGKVIVAAGEFLGVYFAVQAVGMAIDALAALSAAALANPFTAILYAVTALVVVLRQFGDQIDAGVDGATTVKDVLNQLWTVIKGLGKAITDFLGTAWRDLSGSFDKGLNGDGIKLNLRSVLLFIASFVDTTIGLFRYVGDSIMTIMGGVSMMIAKGFEMLVNDIIDAINYLGDKANSVANALGGKVMSVDQLQAISDAKTPEERTKLLKSAQSENEWKPFGQIDHKDFGLGDSGDIVSAFKQKFKDDWKKDITDSNFTKDLVDGFLNEAAKNASVEGKKRGNLDPATAAGARIPSEAEIKAWNALERQLRAVESASNSIVEAEMKLAHAEDVVERAVKVGMITREHGNQIIADTTDKLRDQLEPYQALIDKIDLESEALQGNKYERGIDNKMREYELQLHKQGYDLSLVESANLRSQLELLEARHKLADQEVKDTAKINEEMKKHQIEVDKEIATRAKRYDAWEKGNGASDPLNSLDMGLKKFRATVLDVGKDLNKLMDDVLNGIDDMLGRWLRGESVDWKKFADTVLNDMQRMATHALVSKAVDSVVGASGTGAASEAASVAASTKLTAAALGLGTAGGALGTSAAGLGTASGALMASAASLSAAAAAVMAAAASGTMAMGTAGMADAVSGAGGFASGGSFMVSGSGGTDSKLVAFRATPGERVQISTPGQQVSSGASQKSSPTSVYLRNVNVTDPKQSLQAVDTPEGERVIMNIIGRNRGFIRGITGQR